MPDLLPPSDTDLIERCRHLISYLRYGTYLTGFQTGPATAENVDIIYGGDVITTVTPDENGGVYVELPVINPDPSGTVTITARSQQTGKTVTDAIRPIPTVGLSASGTTAADLRAALAPTPFS